MDTSRRNAVSALDCSKVKNYLFWFFLGVGVAAMAMSLQGAPTLASLLRVGSQNPLRSQIEREVGPLVSPDPTGHDGQLYYLIARDPFAIRGDPAVLVGFDNNPPRYRYRRILFPVLAGGFGAFNGKQTLFGMIAWSIIGMGLATAAIADISHTLRLGGVPVLAATFNIGALLSVMLLTADVLAFGLALTGVALTVRDRSKLAVVVFSLAALTKEVYLLVPLSVACWQWVRQDKWLAIRTLLGSTVPVVLWSVWVWTVVPDVPTATDHIGIPLVGLLESANRWFGRNDLGLVQGLLAVYASLTLVAAVLLMALGRISLLVWLAAPWVSLAAVAGAPVWAVPSNAARAFPILWPLIVLMLSGVRTTGWGVRIDPLRRSEKGLSRSIDDSN